MIITRPRGQLPRRPLCIHHERSPCRSNFQFVWHLESFESQKWIWPSVPRHASATSKKLRTPIRLFFFMAHLSPVTLNSRCVYWSLMMPRRNYEQAFSLAVPSLFQGVLLDSSCSHALHSTPLQVSNWKLEFVAFTDIAVPTICLRDEESQKRDGAFSISTGIVRFLPEQLWDG